MGVVQTGLLCAAPTLEGAPFFVLMERRTLFQRGPAGAHYCARQSLSLR
jgi:hypothetical protein